MRKTLILILIFLIFSINLYAEEKLKVATSLFPIKDIAQNIAGEKAEVRFIVPIGANPHSYEPTPSTIVALKKLDLFIGIHFALDGWVEEFIPEDVEFRYLHECKHRKSGGHHHGEEQGETEEGRHFHNPHFWLTLSGGEVIAEKISTFLSEIDSVNSEYYQSNLENYREKLRALHEEIAGEFEDVENKKLIQWHPAWNYFAEDYGLEIVGTIQQGHGDEPSVKQFKALIDKAKAEGVKAVIVRLNVESQTAESLAKEIEGEIVHLDSIGNPEVPEKATYLKLMKYNAKKLAEALQ
jgi:zinc transport system substrate-binding protein